jgi:hypothetical protein
MKRSIALLAILGFLTNIAHADTPSVSYIFPAGGQRGTTVPFRVGGHYLHEGCPFRLDGPGVQAVDRIERTKTLWFEGPVIPQPASQAKEDYPKDYAGQVVIAADAANGPRSWRVTTSQGVTPGMAFVVGDLPEILEKEVDGKPIPTAVTLPLTINGRIYPREDVDIWTFNAKAGETVTCEVNAARIGSGLDPRLEIRDAGNRILAESSDALDADSLIHFTAPADGTYSVHIYDEKFGGLQHYVYRLTLTNRPWVDAVYPLGGQAGTNVAMEVQGANLGDKRERATSVTLSLPAEPAAKILETTIPFGDARSNPVPLDVDTLPEILEPASTTGPNRAVFPCVANGRILKPGEADLWTFAATKGTAYEFDLRAGRLGSPLDSVLTLLDAAGKPVANNDDFPGVQTDSRIAWTAPADGEFTLKVEDRLASRGGPRFAYRLRMAPAPQPDFRLTVPSDTLTIERGKQANLKVNVDRLGGFAEEIELEFVGLPEGVVVTNNKIPKGQPTAQVSLKPEDKTKIQTVAVTIRGKAKVGDQETIRTAQILPGLNPNPQNVTWTPGIVPSEQMLLAIGMPTPFKFTGIFETKFFPRGSVYTRRYPLTRNGFDGPIEVSLADRQNRHLQGVSGPVVTVPAAANEFEYAVSMPAFMEIGRTSRSCLMAVGVVTDVDGSKHKVSYTSEQQNDQIITLVDPARLSVSTMMKSLRVQPGAEVKVPVDINRGVGLSGPVTVALIVPEHMQGLTTGPQTIAADSKAGSVSLRFADKELGPFNAPLMLRAVIQDERGFPVTVETPVELVAE